MQIYVIEIKKSIALYLIDLAAEHRPDVDAIQRIAGDRYIAEPRDRRKHVNRGCDAGADAVLRNSAGEPRKERLAHAAFIRRAFTAAQAPRAALIPGAVIAGKTDQRPVVDAVLLERAENFADTPVQLLHHIAIETRIGLSEKTGRCPERDVQ